MMPRFTAAVLVPLALFQPLMLAGPGLRSASVKLAEDWPETRGQAKAAHPRGAASRSFTPSLREAGAGRPLTVSAAISLTNVLEEIAAAYAKVGGGPVRFNFAGSNVLARQIVNGAPADLFISADEAQMDVVDRAGLLVGGSRVALVGNRLAVVAAPDRVEIIKRAFPVAASAIRRLAMGDPAAVPAGVYARQYLEMKGLWGAYSSRIVPTGNVRAALAAVENGAADAAIVYVTDVESARRAVIALTVPLEDGPRVVYPAAIIASGGSRPAAESFLAYLRGPEAAAIFSRYKFIPYSDSELGIRYSGLGTRGSEFGTRLLDTAKGSPITHFKPEQ
jgi:molybdate transport system substrate-binding protein